MKKTTQKLLFGKSLLIAFVSTIVVTILTVFLSGLTSHRSLLENAFISLTVLAICFLFFIAFGLYNGLNVYDNYSHKLQLKWRKAWKPDNELVPDTSLNFDASFGDDLGGVILGILLWVVVSIVLVFLFFVLQAFLWLTLLFLALAIYWIMIRALKLIFHKSTECEGDLSKSIAYALGYTLLYLGWIYGVIYASTLVG